MNIKTKRNKISICNSSKKTFSDLRKFLKPRTYYQKKKLPRTSSVWLKGNETFHTVNETRHPRYGLRTVHGPLENVRTTENEVTTFRLNRNTFCESHR